MVEHRALNPETEVRYLHREPPNGTSRRTKNDRVYWEISDLPWKLEYFGVEVIEETFKLLEKAKTDKDTVTTREFSVD